MSLTVEDKRLSRNAYMRTRRAARTPEQVEDDRRKGREYERRAGATRSNEQKAAAAVYNRAWKAARSNEQKAAANLVGLKRQQSKRDAWTAAERDTHNAKQRERQRVARAKWTPEQRAADVALTQTWRDANPGRRKSHYASQSVNARIAHNLRSRLAQAVRKGFKTGSAVRDLGCTIPEFRDYIENQFSPGMSWERMREWHLDHIVPLSAFNLQDREQLLVACHFTNLQPLWAKDNLIKGAN